LKGGGGGETRGKRDFSAGATRRLGGKERHGMTVIVLRNGNLFPRFKFNEREKEWNWVRPEKRTCVERKKVEGRWKVENRRGERGSGEVHLGVEFTVQEYFTPYFKFQGLLLPDSYTQTIYDPSIVQSISLLLFPYLTVHLIREGEYIVSR
jgi:hypothetical protein